jgi:hypothetical protein
MRKEPRKPPSPRLIDARIRCDWRGFQPCDVREIDMNGVLVLGRDGSLTRLPKDSTVDLALKLDAGGRVRTHTLRARVEKKSPDGTSLVFTDAELDTYSALLDLTYSGRDQSE